MIFVNVDTQNDFMNMDGALYVPKAEKIKKNLARLTSFARKKGIKIVSTVDKHYGTEEFEEKELKRFGGPFPDHCMAGTEGQEQIDETRAIDPQIVPSIAKVKIKNSKEVVLEKQSYDVFSNKNAKAVFGGVDKAIVYGVATDFCVKAAALRLLDLGVSVTVVSDAIRGVADVSAAIQEMKVKGAVFRTMEEVIDGCCKKD